MGDLSLRWRGAHLGGIHPVGSNHDQGHDGLMARPPAARPVYLKGKASLPITRYSSDGGEPV